ncbi:MAG: hypothetical protein AB7R90_07305 [Reyranellaceae bacterium]
MLKRTGAAVGLSVVGVKQRLSSCEPYAPSRGLG